VQKLLSGHRQTDRQTKTRPTVRPEPLKWLVNITTCMKQNM